VTDYAGFNPLVVVLTAEQAAALIELGFTAVVANPPPDPTLVAAHRHDGLVLLHPTTTTAEDEIDLLHAVTQLRAATATEVRVAPAPTELTAETLRAALDGATLLRPTIQVTTDEAEVTGHALTALSHAPEVFIRAGALMHIQQSATTHLGPGIKQRREREPDAPIIAPIPLSWVEQYLSREARWVVLRRQNLKPTTPPPWAVRQVYEAPSYPRFRHLAGVVESPVLRPDGTVLNTPGYDDETGLLYQPHGTIDPIPDEPAHLDAWNAWLDLAEVVKQFPFEEPVHQAAWLAALLTIFARWSFDGPTPMFFVDANTPAAGKTKLATVTGIIGLGRAPALTTFDTNDAAETKKAITSLLLEGDPLVVFDNIEGKFGDSSIKKLLTSTTWKERILGVNKTTGALPNLTTWIATANNVQLKGRDMPRRLIAIRLRSPLEHPEMRNDLVHPKLEAWVRAERPRLAACALTILRAYAVAGQPDSGKPCGDYPDWCRAVRDAVVWLGLDDPTTTRESLRAIADEASAEHRTLVTAVAAATRTEELTAADIRLKLGTPAGDTALDEAAKMLLQFCHGRNRPDELPSVQQLGHLLAKYRDTVVDHRRIIGRTRQGGYTVWHTENTNEDVLTDGQGELG